MIKYSSFFSILFTVTLLPGFSQDENHRCRDNINSWKTKINELNKNIEHFQDGQILSKKYLQNIIYPEYVAFDMSYGKLETNLIKLFYSLNIEKYKRISIGPFQMQLKFMHTTLHAIPDAVINDSILIAIKYGGYPDMIEKLAYLEEIKTQWKFLLLFEQYCIKNQLLKSINDIDSMINLYNSGNVTNNNIIFTKIKCDRKTYLNWAKFIYNL